LAHPRSLISVPSLLPSQRKLVRERLISITRVRKPTPWPPARSWCRVGPMIRRGGTRPVRGMVRPAHLSSLEAGGQCRFRRSYWMRMNVTIETHGAFWTSQADSSLNRDSFSSELKLSVRRCSGRVRRTIFSHHVRFSRPIGRRLGLGRRRRGGGPTPRNWRTGDDTYSMPFSSLLGDDGNTVAKDLQPARPGRG